MSNPLRHDQHITHHMTYPKNDPQMKTKTMNMTMDKTSVQNCDVRAVSHSCDVFLLEGQLDQCTDLGDCFFVSGLMLQG